MTSEVIDNSWAEVEFEDETLSKANEHCSRAEEQFSAGEISLMDLYKIYQDILPNSMPADADINYGPWTHLLGRRRRLFRLVTGKHLRKSHGCRGGHRYSQYWDACDCMDVARDIQWEIDQEPDLASKKKLECDLHWWIRFSQHRAKFEALAWNW